MNKIDFKHTALLVIDMQRAFVEKGQPLCVTGAAETVPAIHKVVQFVRDKGSKIVWIRRSYKADGSDMEAFRRQRMMKNGTLNVMAEGSYGVLPVKGLEGNKEDYLVIKKRFSGFFQTDLHDYLSQNHINTVLIAGTQTPNCVRATAFDAVSYDYRTIVLLDCTSSMNDAIQENNLADMQEAGMEICSSDSIHQI